MNKYLLGVGVLGVGVLAVLLFVTFTADRNTSNKDTLLIAKEAVRKDGTFTISTSFYPLEYFISRIVGDSAEVVNIGAGLDPHDFTPSVKDLATLQSSDLVVLLGADFEPWGDDVITQLKENKVPVLIVTEHVKLRSLNESEKAEHSHAEEEVVHADGGEAHEKEHDEHAHGEFDPHVWLDPVLTQDMVAKIVETLTAIDPEFASVYETNGAKLIAELSALDTSYRESLSACTIPEAIVSHDAFGYISDRYGLKMHPIAGISTQDEPSVKLLAALAEEAKEGVIAILTEESSVTEYANTLSRETGLQLITINPIEYIVPDGEDYFSLMRQNLKSLVLAYGCSQ